MILLTSFYKSDNEARNAELRECERRNVACSVFSKIMMFVESNDKEFAGHFPPHSYIEWLIAGLDKVASFGIGGRMTYKAYFDFANEHYPAGTVVCLANADIWFDETLLNINEANLGPKTFFACSRWGFMAHPNGQWYWDEGYDLNAPVAQDAWIFRTPIEWDRKVNSLDFELGHMRCDNVVAHTMYKSGYQVLNPTAPGPKSLKLHHEHRSQVHNYGETIPGPMIFVGPCQLP